MHVPLATLARLILLLALAFNGWALPAHAHSAVPPAAASTGQADSDSDCHKDAKGPAGSGVAIAEDCCAGGDCQGCSCVMACASALPVSAATGSGWGTSVAPRAGPADAPAAGSSGDPLRPPIA